MVSSSNLLSVCVCVVLYRCVCLLSFEITAIWRRGRSRPDGRAFHFNLPVGLGFLGGFDLSLDEMVFNVFSLSIVSLVFLVNNHKSSHFVIYRMFSVFFLLLNSTYAMKTKKVFTNIYIKNIEQVLVVCRISFSNILSLSLSYQ